MMADLKYDNIIFV